jgi:hypothetical protein
MPWFRIEMAPADVVAMRPYQVQTEVRDCLLRAGMPEGAALFSTSPAAEGMTYYLSPAAAVVSGEALERWGGVPCERPARGSVVLSYGPEDAERLLEVDR